MEKKDFLKFAIGKYIGYHSSMGIEDPTLSNAQLEFPFIKENDTQLEFPFILQNDYEKWLQSPTDTLGKNRVIRSIAAQSVEHVLDMIGGVRLENKVLIQLLNKYAWPYNMMLLNIEAIKYIDKYTESTLARVLYIELPNFTEGKITFFTLLGNLQKNIQESDAVTTAPKEKTGQV